MYLQRDSAVGVRLPGRPDLPNSLLESGSFRPQLHIGLRRAPLGCTAPDQRPESPSPRLTTPGQTRAREGIVTRMKYERSGLDHGETSAATSLELAAPRNHKNLFRTVTWVGAFVTLATLIVCISQFSSAKSTSPIIEFEQNYPDPAIYAIGGELKINKGCLTSNSALLAWPLPTEWDDTRNSATVHKGPNSTRVFFVGSPMGEFAGVAYPLDEVEVIINDQAAMERIRTCATGTGLESVLVVE